MVFVDGIKRVALVDSGCTSTMVKAGIVRECDGNSSIIAFDGSEVACVGSSKATLAICGQELDSVVLVVEKLVAGYEIVLGMDIIMKLGGLHIDKCGNVVFGAGFKGGTVHDLCAVSQQGCPTKIDDPDFEAYFNGKYWTVEWKWKDEALPVLKNTIACYSKGMSAEKKAGFECEVDKWINEGILVPWEGEVSGCLALMAVEQPTKNKIRPVLDYRELNQYVECHTGDDVTDICSEKLRMEKGGRCRDCRSSQRVFTDPDC